jgi:hypothetical protein
MDATAKGDGSKAPRRGINWLSIIGIVILVLLIAGAVWLWWFYNASKSNRLIQAIADLAPALKDMENQTQSQIEQQAQSIEAADVGADPTGFSDRYYVIEGTVSAEESMAVDKEIALGIFSDTEFKGMILDQAVVLIDLLGTAPAPLPDGTVVRGYGRLFVLDIEDVWKLPVVGPNLKKEFGGVVGTMRNVPFFLSKGLKVISVPTKGGGGPPVPPGQATKPGEPGATTPPAAGGAAAPPAGGAAPPAGGATPPAGGGETKPPAGGG